MSLTDYWSENFLTTADFAAWNSDNYDDTDWKVVPFDDTSSSKLSVKIGL
jgi:hypothetical protein